MERVRRQNEMCKIVIEVVSTLDQSQARFSTDLANLAFDFKGFILTRKSARV